METKDIITTCTAIIGCITGITGILLNIIPRMRKPRTIVGLDANIIFALKKTDVAYRLNRAGISEQEAQLLIEKYFYGGRQMALESNLSNRLECWIEFSGKLVNASNKTIVWNELTVYYEPNPIIAYKYDTRYGSNIEAKSKLGEYSGFPIVIPPGTEIVFTSPKSYLDDGFLMLLEQLIYDDEVKQKMVITKDFVFKFKFDYGILEYMKHLKIRFENHIINGDPS